MRYRSQRSAWLEALRKIVQAIGPAIRSQALRDGVLSINPSPVLVQNNSCPRACRQLLTCFPQHSQFQKKEKSTKKERTAAVAPQALQPAQSNYKDRQ